MKFSLFLLFAGEILRKCYSNDDKGGAATSNDSAHHRAFQREKLIEYVFGEEGQHPLMKKIALEHNESDFEKRAVETINNIRSSGCSCVDCQRSIITYVTKWWDSFDEQGWSYAVKGFMTGLYRSGYEGFDNDHIFRLEEVESKDAPAQYSTFVDCYNANWWDSFDINNSWSKCKTGYYMTGLYRSGSMNSDYYGQSLHNIEESRCCRPVNAKEEWGQCYEQSVSFVNKGWSKCKDGYYMAGMYRGNGDFLHNIQTFFCCKMGPLSSKPKCCSKPTHHPTPKPTHHPTPMHDLSLKRNHLYTTINGYSKEWVLSFKLNPKSTRKNWNSIIRFTSTNNDYGGYGDRWLGLWFEANSYTLHVVAGTTDSHNRYRNVDGVQKGIDNDIEIMGVGDVIKVYVNGNLKDDTMLNINRPSVQELKVYASDKFYEPADATLKDFSFIFNLPTRPPTPKQTQAPVQACSGIVKPGGDVRTFFSVQMGRTSGWFHMSYEFLRVKDRIQVSYEGKTLYDTKTFISGCHRNIKVSYGPGTSTKVDFLVTSQDSGTLWYVATSCPSSTELPNVCR